MNHWSLAARKKRMNEKKASKKTREGLMDAYHKLRAINEEEQRERNRQREIQAVESLEGLPRVDHQGEGVALSDVRDQEDGEGA